MSIPKWKVYFPKIIGAAIVVAVGIGMIWLINEFLETEQAKPKKLVHKVTLLKPPPPPPPPKIERPPEPEVQEQVEVPEPETLEELPEMADEMPAGDLLGLDAEGAAGTDGFGLIARKGGRGLLSGDPHVIYASQLQRLIEESLLDHEPLRKKAYSVVAKIWVDPNGSILRAELLRTSGHEAIDEKLVDLIVSVRSMAEAPPENMPQPIKLKITSRL